MRDLLDQGLNLVEQLERLDPDQAVPLRQLRAQVQARLDRDLPIIAIIGEKKSGKSTFLNALMATPLLGAAAREYTGTLVYLQAGPMHWEAIFEDGHMEQFDNNDPTIAYEPLLQALKADVSEAEENLQQAWMAQDLAVKEAQVAQEDLAACQTRLPVWLQGPGPWWYAFLAWCFGWWYRHAQLQLAQAGPPLMAAQQRYQEVQAHVAQCTAQRSLAQQELQAGLAALQAAIAARLARFQNDILRLTDMNQQGKNLHCLRVFWPSLPEGFCWLDSPGINTDDPDNQRRAWEAIAAADACVLVSDLGQAVSSSTLEFAQRVATDLPHLFLLLSKADQALEGSDDPQTAQADVDEAVAVAVHRFAEATGRPLHRFLALPVAAAPALSDPGGPAGQVFRQQCSHLLQVLAQDRVNVLQSRAIALFEAGRSALDHRLAALETQAQARLQQLMDCRLPDPQQYQAQLLAELPADQSLALCQRFLVLALSGLKNRLSLELQTIHDRAALGRWNDALPERLNTELQALQQAIHEEICQSAADLHAQASVRAFQQIQERYQIVETLHPQLSPPPLMRRLLHADPTQLDTHFQRFDQERLGLGAGGALAGALVGSLIMPGVGTVVGGALGALAGLLVGLEQLKRDCMQALSAWESQSLPPLQAWLLTQHETARAQTQAQRQQELASVLAQYNTWIEQLIAAEQQQQQEAQSQLQRIVALKADLGRCLDALYQSAPASS